MKRRILERLIPWMVALLPLIALGLGTAAMYGYFVKRIDTYALRENRQTFEAVVARSQARTDVRTRDLVSLLHYEESRLEKRMRQELRSKVQVARETARKLFGEFHGKLKRRTLETLLVDALSQMTWNDRRDYIWITDEKGNSLLSGSAKLAGRNLYDYKDADGKPVIRHEIALAKTKGEGFLRSHFFDRNDTRLIYVRRFEPMHWVIGSALSYAAERAALKRRFTDMIGEIAWEPDAFVMLFDANGTLLAHSRANEKIAKASKATAGLASGAWRRVGDLFVKKVPVGFDGWTLVGGFDSSVFAQTYALRSEALAHLVKEEKKSIAEAASAIAALVALIALLLAKAVTAAFARYREQVRIRENALRELNATLEARVEQEVEKRRRGEKMLIQQSKMAAMGDMISMIAHQWRQPLNRLSYMLMNVEGAYEHGELDGKYLATKLGEAEKTLEYMSHTINDFRHFFRPDKQRETVSVATVAEQTLALIDKSFEAHGIEIVRDMQCEESLPLYRNELIQVLVNILQNAKDVLIERAVEEPAIELKCFETGQFVVVRICDNAGGIDKATAEHIFEPYYSTKEARHGTGLGLYMARTIVEEHFNGVVTFFNGEKGACFDVKIGRVQDA